MNHTLVTGGAGFIGSHLVRLLVDQGRRVRVLDRRGAPVEHLPLANVELVRADIRDRAAVDDCVRGCEAVFHLAANPNLWTHRRGHFRQVNFRGTMNVLDAALAAGVRRILHTSTESILTRAAQTGPIPADVVVRPHDVVGPYCRSKYDAEVYALNLARSGAPIVVVNPTCRSDPRPGRSPPTQMMLDFVRRRREYLVADLNLIDVRDAPREWCRLEHGRTGRRYRWHENIPSRDFPETLYANGISAEMRVPYPVALTAAYVGEFVRRATRRRPPRRSRRN